MRSGLLGGTFDPIHLGHLAAADSAFDCARLDRVVLMPSYRPPHRDPAHASPEARLAMCRLAVEGIPLREVSDLEIRRDGVSYTSDTLVELRSVYPEDDWFLILGWDAASQFNTWHRPELVTELAQLVVVGRPGVAMPDEEQLSKAGIEPDRAVLCPGSTPAVSGTDVRARIARGDSVVHLVPAEVERYIAAHRLYVDNR